ncbi:unnamed protein product [Protopolystoma xenopodis]|uniref:Uncharacterized protein n=1 Tax=Protopolystoma xenopodis TaxID=117903 RepID=A0A448WEU0_9PLAT|nr:unnamed protein product [Protopolystoma xenopodis]
MSNFRGPDFAVNRQSGRRYRPHVQIGPAAERRADRPGYQDFGFICLLQISPGTTGNLGESNATPLSISIASASSTYTKRLKLTSRKNVVKGSKINNGYEVVRKR